MKKLIVLAALVVGSSAVQADELILSSAKSKGGQVAAIDYVSDGQTVAFDFKIAVPGGEAAKVDLSRAVADLPKSHTGQCNFAKGNIICLVYNDANVALPAGVHKIGTVSVSSSGAGELAVSSFSPVDATAAPVSSKIRNASAAK